MGLYFPLPEDTQAETPRETEDKILAVSHHVETT